MADNINGVELPAEVAKLSPDEVAKIKKQQDLLDHFVKKLSEGSALFAIAEERRLNPGASGDDGFTLLQVRRIATMAAATAILGYQELDAAQLAPTAPAG